MVHDLQESTRARNARRVADRRAYIAVLRDVPCADCGLTYHPAMMEFDHRPGEEIGFRLGNAATRSRADIDAEAAKCDVVCANCHRMRTHVRRLRAS